MSTAAGLPPALTRAGRGRSAPVEGGLRAVQVAVLRAFGATGRPPAPGELDVAGVADVEAIVRRLHAEDFLRLDEAGRIVAAYPFSATPTPHRVRLADGATVDAMCAIDALGIPRMLGRAAAVHSTDPVTGDAVTIGLDAAGRLRDHAPRAAVVLVGATAHGDGCAAAEVCCSTVSFFGSSATARAWLDGHPEVRGPVLDLPGALELANEVFGHLLDRDNATLS